MRIYLKLVLLFAFTAGLAWLASRILVPDAVPVADSQQPQWYLQLAFVLKSIQLIGIGGLATVLVAGVATRFERPSP
jgi:hypothetical protein